MQPIFVAEICSNHNGSLSRAIELIKCAAKAGADVAKFQLFRMDKLFAPEVMARSLKHQDRRAWELPVEWLPTLAAACKKYGIKFACTPFYLEAVEQLYPYVAFYKISSYDLLRTDLLKAVAATGKPVVLSTGMATVEEVKRASSTIRTGGCEDLTALYCVSSYPATEVYLSVIDSLEWIIPQWVSIGYSDHTVSPAVIYRAVHRWKASMVEFHLDLDGQGWEFGLGHCWLPEQVGTMIKTVRDGIAADGSRGVKLPAVSELLERNWRADPSDGLRPMREMREK